MAEAARVLKGKSPRAGPSGHDTRLKWWLRARGIRAEDLAQALGRARSIIVNLLNGRGKWPSWNFRDEKLLRDFLKQHQLDRKTALEPATDEEISAAQEEMASRGFTHWAAYKVNGNFDRRVQVQKREAKVRGKKSKGREVEPEMLSFEAINHFRLKADPFTNEIRGKSDVFFNEENTTIKQAILSAAKNQGLLALIGEVGSGKSTILQAALGSLNGDDSIQVIYPQAVAKERLTAVQITEAIVRDLNPTAVPRAAVEARSRQVRELLEARAAEGGTAVLILEEAHALPITTIRQLKRFYELTQARGYRKLLGIILVGQPELEAKFRSHEIREVAKRVRVVKLGGLPKRNGIQKYLEHKISRAGGDAGRIFDGDVYSLLARVRWASNPLDLNNIVIRAMNQAVRIGSPKITREIIGAIPNVELAERGETRE